MVQSLSRCKSCGLPEELAKKVNWGSDGTIRLKPFKRARLAMIDIQSIDIFYDKLAAANILDAFCLDVKRGMRRLTAVLLSGIKGRITRYGPMKKRMLELIEESSSILGIGRIEIERFSPGQSGSLLLVKPFNSHLVSAGLIGILEELDKCSYAHALSAVTENTYRLELSVEGAYDKDGLIGELQLKNGAAGGRKPRGACELCGSPSWLTEFIWDELYGIVEVGPDERRICILPVHSVPSIGAISRQPDDPLRLLEQSIYESTMNGFEDGMTDTYEGGEWLRDLGRVGPVRETWEVLGRRGWGMIGEARQDGGIWQVEVIRAIDAGIIAGWLRALYTIAMGKEPNISHSYEADTIRYILQGEEP